MANKYCEKFPIEHHTVDVALNIYVFTSIPYVMWPQ